MDRLLPHPFNERKKVYKWRFVLALMGLTDGDGNRRRENDRRADKAIHANDLVEKRRIPDEDKDNVQVPHDGRNADIFELESLGHTELSDKAKETRAKARPPHGRRQV